MVSSRHFTRFTLPKVRRDYLDTLYSETIYNIYMPALLVNLDDSTYRALNQIAPAAKRRRAEFIRTAIKKAIREAEFDRIRRAYELQPDSAAEADDWSTCEEYKP